MSKKLELSVRIIPVLLVVLALLNIIIGLFSIHDLKLFFIYMAFILLSAPILTLIGMVFNRLITTKWGKFLNGYPLFQIACGIIYPFLFIHLIWLVSVLILILTAGFIFLFIQYGTRFIFVKKAIFSDATWQKTGGFVSGIPLFFNRVLNKVHLFFVQTGKTFSQVKFLRKILFGISGVLLFIVLIFLFGKLFINGVKSFAPSGETGLSTAVQVTFQDIIELPKEDIVVMEQNGASEYSNITPVTNLVFIKSGIDYFKINPAVKGEYHLEDGKKLVFIPSEPLILSTDYRVEINTSKIKTKGKLLFGKVFKFSTPSFKVTGARLFFNYDIMNNLEKEIVAELNFNSPVEIESLKKYTYLGLEGKQLEFTVEPSNTPTRFYIKSGRISRKDKPSEIQLKIRAGLPGLKSTKPLDIDYQTKINLPETTKLNVIRSDNWPVSGNTYISLLFNIPVSSSDIKQSVSIVHKENQEIPYTVETEYCYAVLKADFQPNEVYSIRVNKGLKSISGQVLEKDFKYDIRIKDLQSEVNFKSHGMLLPSAGNLDMELYSQNLDRYQIRIDKIYRNNLIYYLQNPGSSSFGKPLLLKNVEVTEGSLNEKVHQFINLRKFQQMDYKGLFRITLIDPKNTGGSQDVNPDDSNEIPRDFAEGNARNVLCTDLGMMAKLSGKDLIVRVYSILGLTPVNGANVKILSTENQVIQNANTGPDGEIVFKDWQVNENHFVPFVMTAEYGEDFSYLQFSSSIIDQSRFAIGGKNTDQSEMEAFLTPERGVYRPGEKAYIIAIVRNGDLSLPKELSVQLLVNDPSGQKFALYRRKIPKNGLLYFEIPFPNYAKTGQYEVNLRLDDKITLGYTSLKVEEFIPNKISIDITSKTAGADLQHPLVFSVKGVQLYGPPASGYPLLTQIRYTSRIFTLPSYPDYIFNDPDRNYDHELVNFGKDALDPDGIKTYSVDVPANTLPPSALLATVYTEVYDDGGRAVSSVKSFQVDRYPYYLGIKLDSKDQYLKGDTVGLSYIAVDSKGKSLSLTNIRLLVKRQTFYSILRKYQRNDSRYESESYEEVVSVKDISINESGKFSFKPDQPGYYSVYLGNDTDMRTGVRFYVRGEGLESVDLGKAENLSIVLDKEKYKPSDTAAVTIRSAIPGKLFLSIEREKVLYSRIADITEGKVTVSIPINEEYLPNAYITAYVIRKPDEKYKDLPMSALGIKSLDVDPGLRKIEPVMECAEKTRSQDGLDVKVRVPESSRNSGVVLAAVDEGILQITHFETPDPFNFFYGKRSLDTKLYSIFDFVLPNVKAAKLAVGGDEENYDLSQRHVNPLAAKRVISVALYSGILTPDEKGEVKYHFDIPRFNGRLRVMAITADNNRFGSASRYTTVSDPIVINPSLPRVAAPNDIFDVPVRIFNNKGKTGSFSISLTVKGPVSVQGTKIQSVVLEAGAEKEVLFHCRSTQDSGIAEFTFQASGAGEKALAGLEMAIRPAVNLKTTTLSGELDSGKAASLKIPGGLSPYGMRVRFSASSLTITKYLGSLEYLIHYPYGCAEQITSSAFPLLYYKKLADLSGAFTANGAGLDFYIAEAIQNLESLQMPDGQFAYWPGMNSSNPSVSLYVSEFLLRAELASYPVDPAVMQKLKEMIGLEGTVKKGRLDRRDNGVSQNNTDPYLLYLKSLAGKPDRESMDYLKANSISSMDYADRCLLAKAYALSGDKISAKAALPNEFVLKFFPRSLGGSLDSVVRKLSLYLSAVTEIDSSDARIAALVKELEKNLVNGRFGTTYENSLALAALAEAYESEKDSDIQAAILTDGKTFSELNGNRAVIDANTLSGKTITLTNKSTNPLFYNLYAEGIPLTNAMTPTAQGIEIKRVYFNKQGNRLNLSGVIQGDLVIATITLTVNKSLVDNLVVVDLLPAGLEIENPRLNSRGDLEFNPPNNWNSAYQDIRDDRIILFTGQTSGTMQYSYTLRAVTPGEYTVPQVFAEAMYDPSIYSIGAKTANIYVVQNKK